MRRSAWFFVAALTLTLSCSKENNPTGPTRDTAPTSTLPRVTVFGVVISSFRDTPILNATVRVTGDEATSGTSITDDNGYFSVANIAGSVVTVAVSATGFADTSANRPVSGDRPLTFRLTPTTRAALFGVVRDVKDEPLSGVRVSASGGDTSFVSTMTDGGGFYHLAGIAPGRITAKWDRVDLSEETKNLVFEYTDMRQDVTMFGHTTSSADYTITGTARRCAITYANIVGQMVDADVALPWSYHLIPSPGDTLFVRCRISTVGDTGTVTVGISRQGQTSYSATAVGYPNTATASGIY